MKKRVVLLVVLLLAGIIVGYILLTKDSGGNNVSDVSKQNGNSESSAVSSVPSEVSKEASSAVSREDSLAGTSSATQSEDISEAESETQSEISSSSESSASQISEISEKQDESSEDVSKAPVSYTEVTKVNDLILAGTRLMETYGGGAQSSVNFAGYVNKFKEYLGSNVNVYSMPVPISCGVYAPDKYISCANQHDTNFANVRNNLIGVTDVDILTVLRAHADEGLYFRSDHHWNALGAYYAAQTLAEKCGVGFKELNDDNYLTHSFDGFYGSLYKVAGYPDAIKDNPETFTWYEPKANYTLNYYTRDKFTDGRSGSLYVASDSYIKFLSGDSYCTEIFTECDNGRVLWLIKDSFGNALPQYLLGSFSKIYVADVRYFELDASEFVQEHGITDVCVSLSAYSILNSNGKALLGMIK